MSIYREDARMNNLSTFFFLQENYVVAEALMVHVISRTSKSFKIKDSYSHQCDGFGFIRHSERKKNRHNAWQI